MPIGIRRQARMIALQTLYEYDTVQHSPEEVLQRHIEDRHLQPKIVEYARELVLVFVTTLLKSTRTYRVRHKNGLYNKWPELIKIFLDLQSTKFCLIIRYQQRLLLTKRWSLPKSLAVILPADLSTASLVRYLIGHNSSPPQ